MRRRPLLGALTPAQLFVLVIAGALLAWVTFFISVKVERHRHRHAGLRQLPRSSHCSRSLIFREQVRLAEWPLLGLVGAGLVLVTPSFDLADQGTIGLAWGVLSGLTFALLALSSSASSASGAGFPDAGGLLARPGGGTGAAAVRGRPVAALPAVDWLWLALLGVFCTGLSHFLFVSSLSTPERPQRELVIALEPVYAIAFAWVLFSQQPDAHDGRRGADRGRHRLVGARRRRRRVRRKSSLDNY